jgi:hypothetical protein
VKGSRLYPVVEAIQALALALLRTLANALPIDDGELAREREPRIAEEVQEDSSWLLRRHGDEPKQHDPSGRRHLSIGRTNAVPSAPSPPDAGGGTGASPPRAAASRRLRGTHHGVGHGHLQAYLDEFAFRFNRRRTLSVFRR